MYIQPAHARKPDDNELKFLQRLQDNGITAEHKLLKTSCYTIQDAATAVGAKPSDFVKNVCMIAKTSDGKSHFVIAIVPGDRRGSRSRAHGELKLLGLDLPVMPEMATAEEIIAFTGYPPGGTPSFCYDSAEIIIFVDEKLALEDRLVYTGGGSELSLCQIKVSELMRASKGIVAKVSDKIK